VFFFALALFIMTFTNLNSDGSMPSAASLLSRYTVVFIVAILVGAAVGYFLLQKGGYVGLAGLATGVVAAIISAPTAAIVFGGVTGGGTDLLVAAFRASGAPLMSSVLAQGSVSDPFDKMLSYMIVWLILQSLPTRFKAR
jgi:energy-coupling factor transport system substrate-specific component